MIEQGIVADARDGKLIVNIRRHPACGSCKACGAAEGRLMKIELENTVDAQKGDRVSIELDDTAILRGALFFYGIPLLGLLFGIFIGKMIAERMHIGMPHEAASALFGMITMLLTFIGVRRYNSANKEKYKPRIVRS